MIPWKNLIPTIEETLVLDLISLNPVNPSRVENSKYDRLIWLNISNIVALWTEAWKSTESEITTKKSILPIFEEVKWD